MTTAELIQTAVRQIESTPGYNYDHRALAAVIERGLQVGDRVQAGNGRMTYVGDGVIRIERDGAPAVDRPADETAQQRFLLHVAVAAAQRGAYVGA